MDRHSSMNRAWWKEASVYQVYPASFQDSNGDGVGDVPGIITRLDHIQALGVDVLWVSPVTKSPQVDMGYDVSDYRDIHPPYGTMADVECLIDECHSRGIKLVMDMVFNHTSDQHEWFRNSVSALDNEYRDFYIWRKPRYDSNGRRKPPNNWRADFVGSAWTYDEQTKEYYLGVYSSAQPDLNWEHPPVRQAVHDILNFWLDKGVDGFRLDVINQISKVPGLPDAPVIRPELEFQPGHQFYSCGPRLHEYLKGIGNVLRKRNAFAIGEMPCVDSPKEVINAVASDRGELDMIINFDLMMTDIAGFMKFSPDGPRNWCLTDFKRTVDKWQTSMIDHHGWNALYLENHDNGRSVSRWGSDLPEHRALCSKMLATCLVFQSGTVFVYQGQELGMINIPKERAIEDYRDLETLNAWHEILESHPTDYALHSVIMNEIHLKSRDHARTPMQWNASQYAGFSTVEPWQKENPSYLDVNAISQVGVSDSVFEHWASALRLRKAHIDIFVYGSFTLIDSENENVFAYARSYGQDRATVVCNFKTYEVEWSLHQQRQIEGEVLIQNYPDVKIRNGSLILRPFEALVYLSTMPA